MKRARFAIAAFGICLIVAGAGSLVAAASLEELIAAAREEGTIEFYAPSTLTPQGAKALGNAFNKKYGLAIQLNYHPSQNMSRNVGLLISRAATGVPPEWDVMVVTDAHHASLWLRRLHQPFPYEELGVEAKVINFDKGTLSVAHQVVLPAYNRNVLSPADAPRSWDDLLDPKWKGKLAVSTATHHFGRLAVGAWGEERTRKYIRQLVMQDLNLGRMSEIYTRLLIGEVSVSFTLTDSFIFRAKKKGAPLVHAEDVEPVIAPAYQIGVLKDAPHPNVGHLFSVFLTTNEGQMIWEKHTGQTSAFAPGTSTYKRLHGKAAVFMTQDDAERVDHLAREFGKMLGFK